MIVTGLQKVSLIDYPEKIACVVFVSGCNFRCPYCQNPELVDPELKLPEISESLLFDFLKRRRTKLDGVVISGGEPTLQKDLSEFSARVKRVGFLVKLDTNGSRPDVLKALLKDNLVDYVAMDLKSQLKRYQEVVRAPVDLMALRESIEIIRASSVVHEFRITILPRLHKEEDIRETAKLIRGTRLFALQNFSAGKTLDPDFSAERGFTEAALMSFKAIAERYVKRCIIRN